MLVGLRCTHHFANQTADKRHGAVGACLHRLTLQCEGVWWWLGVMMINSAGNSSCGVRGGDGGCFREGWRRRCRGVLVGGGGAWRWVGGGW
jgi:hypothetical protein